MFYPTPFSAPCKSLHVDYVEGVLSGLAALLPLMHHPKGTSSLSFLGLRREEICASQEYRLVAEFFPELAEDEIIYLTLHLLGSRLTGFILLHFQLLVKA